MEFIDWMESQNLKAKEMVELLEQCLSVGYRAVMLRQTTSPEKHTVTDPVPVNVVDLTQYDSLCGQGMHAS